MMLTMLRKTCKGNCMMKTIVEEKPISFKELEQKIFSYVCELGREITTAMLEAYDKELAEGRDKRINGIKGSAPPR